MKPTVRNFWMLVKPFEFREHGMLLASRACQRPINATARELLDKAKDSSPSHYHIVKGYFGLGKIGIEQPSAGWLIVTQLAGDVVALVSALSLATANVA